MSCFQGFHCESAVEIAFDYSAAKQTMRGATAGKSIAASPQPADKDKNRMKRSFY